MDVQHLNAHATSTPVGDLGEVAAIKAVFGRPWTVGDNIARCRRPATCLGAAGGHQSGLHGACLARPDCACRPSIWIIPIRRRREFDLIGRRGAESPVEHAISNGFGFGGVNASEIFPRLVKVEVADQQQHETKSVTWLHEAWSTPIERSRTMDDRGGSPAA